MDPFYDARVPTGLGGRFYGVLPALVVDVVDPLGQGRVKVRLPWSDDGGGSPYQAWARLATLMAGAGRGSWFVPDVGDEVLVAFAAGDPSQPFVLGALWNGRDAPPAAMDGGGRNERKELRSRNGVSVALEDRDGQESFVVETPGGQRLTLSDGPGRVRLEDSNGNSLELGPDGVRIVAAGTVDIQASQVKASAGMVTVEAGMSRFSGVLQSDTCIATTVIGATYTPGAGNIW